MKVEMARPYLSPTLLGRDVHAHIDVAGIPGPTRNASFAYAADTGGRGGRVSVSRRVSLAQNMNVSGLGRGSGNMLIVQLYESRIESGDDGRVQGIVRRRLFLFNLS